MCVEITSNAGCVDIDICLWLTKKENRNVWLHPSGISLWSVPQALKFRKSVGPKRPEFPQDCAFSNAKQYKGPVWMILKLNRSHPKNQSDQREGVRREPTCDKCATAVTRSDRPTHPVVIVTIFIFSFMRDIYPATTIKHNVSTLIKYAGVRNRGDDTCWHDVEMILILALLLLRSENSAAFWFVYLFIPWLVFGLSRGGGGAVIIHSCVNSCIYISYVTCEIWCRT